MLTVQHLDVESASCHISGHEDGRLPRPKTAERLHHEKPLFIFILIYKANLGQVRLRQRL
jgi:hypothetical protein